MDEDWIVSRKRRPGDKIKARFNAYAERIEQGDFRHSCPVGTVCLDLDADWLAELAERESIR